MRALALCVATLAVCAAMPTARCPVGWTVYAPEHSGGGVRGADVGASNGVRAGSACLTVSSAHVPLDKAACPTVDGRASHLLTMDSLGVGAMMSSDEKSMATSLAAVARLARGTYAAFATQCYLKYSCTFARHCVGGGSAHCCTRTVPCYGMLHVYTTHVV